MKNCEKLYKQLVSTYKQSNLNTSPKFKEQESNAEIYNHVYSTVEQFLELKK